MKVREGISARYYEAHLRRSVALICERVRPLNRYHAAVVPLAVPGEQRVHRANEEWTLDFEPLVTEDRLYRDLRMESSEEGLIVNLGEKRTSALLFPALKAILTGKHPSANLLQ